MLFKIYTKYYAYENQCNILVSHKINEICIIKFRFLNLLVQHSYLIQIFINREHIEQYATST